MENSAKKELCESMLKTQFFMFEGIDTHIYSALIQIGQLLWMKEQLIFKAIMGDRLVKCYPAPEVYTFKHFYLLD